MNTTRGIRKHNNKVFLSDVDILLHLVHFILTDNVLGQKVQVCGDALYECALNYFVK